jgi:hypothetical protein
MHGQDAAGVPGEGDRVDRLPRGGDALADRGGVLVDLRQQARLREASTRPSTPTMAMT